MAFKNSLKILTLSDSSGICSNADTPSKRLLTYTCTITGPEVML